MRRQFIIGGLFFIVLLSIVGFNAYQLGLKEEIKKEVKEIIKEEISFEPLVRILVESDQFIAETKENGSTLISAEGIMRLFFEESGQWFKTENELITPYTPEITVYIALKERIQLRFYLLPTELMQMVTQEGVQVYEVPKGTTEKIISMHKASNTVIPSVLTRALLYEERIDQSPERNKPNVESYGVLKIGGDYLYIYEQGEHYVLDTPYGYKSFVSEEMYGNLLYYTTEDVGDFTSSINIESYVDTEQYIKLEPFSGYVGGGFEKVGTLYSGDELFFEKGGFYYKLEKGYRIVLKREDYFYSVINGLPGRPSISPNRETFAFIDMIEFESKGNLFVYDPEVGRSDKMTFFDYPATSSNTVKDLMWLDDETLLLIIGFDTGTITQGGNVYKLNINTKALTLIYETKLGEEVANIQWQGDQILFEEVYWLDDNYEAYSYREVIFSVDDLWAMKDILN